MGASCTGASGWRRTRCSRRARRWLLVFFVVPMYYLAKMSLEQGLFPLFSFGWAWSNFSDAVSLVPDAVRALARVRGHRDRDRAR